MIATILALALAAPAAPEDKEKELTAAAKKELKALEGKWTVTKLAIDGNDVPAPESDEKNIEFKGRKFLLGGKEIFDIDSLDPSTDPKLIDFKGLADMGEIRTGTVYEGIYKLEKDTLTLALYFGEGQKRPTKFESEKDAKVAIVTLEREKK
jgi:uncharacterized protein (TIGR03067 family)